MLVGTNWHFSHIARSHKGVMVSADQYFGTYARFSTVSKKDAGPLMGADNLVGDTYTVAVESFEGQPRAWLINKFGAKAGYFDEATTQQVQLLLARNWTLYASLAFVAFTDRPDPGFYWGEAVLIAWDPTLDSAMNPFFTSVKKLLSEGIRPAVDLGNQGVAEVIKSQGTWVPKERVPMPPKEAGTVIMKSRRKLSENMIEVGRSGNKGCLAAGIVIDIVVILLLIAAVIFGLKSCGVF